MSTPKENLFPIKRLSRYELINLLGEGAMGRVYLAEDPVLRRQVAIKVIALERSVNETTRQEFLKRFAFEAQACAKLSHPSIVTVYDAGEQDGIPWIAFEYVKGEGLDQLLQRHKTLPFDKIRSITVQIASALHLAHQQHIIHRDVKPANILIDSQNGIAKLTDFGVVKAPWIGLTQSGVSVGSPGYMSPEQIDGSAVDARSDLFSFGVVLYELITGKHPFLRDSVPATFYATINQDYPPLKSLRQDIPEDLEKAVTALLKASKDERISSAAELISMINHPDAADIAKSSSPLNQRSPRIFFTKQNLINTSKAIIEQVSFLFLSTNRKGIKYLLKKSNVSADKIYSYLKNSCRQNLPNQKNTNSFYNYIPVLCAFLLSAFFIVLPFLILHSRKSQEINIPQKEKPSVPSYMHQFDSLLNAKNLDSAYKLLTEHSGSKKNSWSEFFLGRLELKKENYLTADEHFNTALEMDKEVLKYQIDPLIDDLEEIFRKEKAPEQLVNLVSRTLSLSGHKRISQWLNHNHYWVRWNTVKVMEAAGVKVDMVNIYMLDLNSNASMRTRIRAAEKLGEMGDRRAVPLLEEIGSRRMRDPFVSATARNILSKYFNNDTASQKN